MADERDDAVDDGLTDEAVLHYKRVAEAEKKHPKSVGRPFLPVDGVQMASAGAGTAAVVFMEQDLHASVSAAPRMTRGALVTMPTSCPAPSRAPTTPRRRGSDAPGRAPRCVAPEPAGERRQRCCGRTRAHDGARGLRRGVGSPAAAGAPGAMAPGGMLPGAPRRRCSPRVQSRAPPAPCP
ncbi:hypothetical protein G7085_00770 [Tessaracoccus sp. HDW20]|uniref:hypothetical protein n=1 Tax=Tessaracoccus coleopterorum TaxID=2714950 RepID=UPI0018D34746|nr:hypothetical protein [Tessaracoccus coleopterorum]NHB83726.1 hypothetical protein [Tessaracoccus coleopterorum]